MRSNLPSKSQKNPRVYSGSIKTSEVIFKELLSKKKAEILHREVELLHWVLGMPEEKS